MFSKVDGESKREKIIEATEELIRGKGRADLTSRRIAEHAAVNPAMINYYFGSKEGLIECVLSRVISIGDAGNLPKGSDIRKTLFDNIMSICEYSLTRSQYLVGTNITPDAERISENLTEYFRGSRSGRECYIIACRTIGVLDIALNDPDGFLKCTGIDIRNKMGLRSFVSRELDVMLGDPL